MNRAEAERRAREISGHPVGAHRDFICVLCTRIADTLQLAAQEARRTRDETVGQSCHFPRNPGRSLDARRAAF